MPLFAMRGIFLLNNYLTVMDVDGDDGVAADVAVEDGFGEEVDELLLH